MVLDPRHLVQLHTIVELGSFAAAADRLALTQPALTRNIRLLESRVGTKLLERGRHGAVPTAVGATLSAQGRSLRDVMQRATQMAARGQAGDTRQLRLGSAFAMANDVMTEPIVRYLQRLPHVFVKMSIGPTPVLLDQLRTGDLDLVLGGTQLVGTRQGLHFEPLIRNRLAVLARTGHPLATGAAISMEQLRRSQWIVPSAHDPLLAEVTAAMTHMGLSADHIAFETGSPGLALSVMMATDLLLLEPAASTRQHVLSGRIAELPVPLSMPLRPVGIAWREDPALGPVIAEFLTIARDWSRQFADPVDACSPG